MEKSQARTLTKMTRKDRATDLLDVPDHRWKLTCRPVSPVKNILEPLSLLHGPRLDPPFARLCPKGRPPPQTLQFLCSPLRLTLSDPASLP